MSLTEHAKTRCRQRGFNSYIVEIITTYGRVENAPGGATRIFFGKREIQDILREIKRFIQMVSKANGGTLILKENDIITAYRKG